MELVTVKELYKNREAYLDNQVTVGGWVRRFVILRHLGLSLSMTVHF